MNKVQIYIDFINFINELEIIFVLHLIGKRYSSHLESGLHKVQILDLAVGTGTFLYAVFNQIFYKSLKNKGMWSLNRMKNPRRYFMRI